MADTFLDGVKNASSMRVFLWSGETVIMDKEFTQKYCRLMELNQQALFQLDGCRYEKKANHEITGRLVVCASRQVVFKYASGLFGKKEKKVSFYFDETASVKTDAQTKLIFRATANNENKAYPKQKDFVFTLPSGDARAAMIRILEMIEAPEYVALPGGTRSIMFMMSQDVDAPAVVSEERGNTPGNITNGGFAARQGEWIYYSNMSHIGYAYTPPSHRNDNYKKLCKVRADGSGKTLLCDDRCKFVNVLGDWIFYCNESDFGKLYKIRTDGTGRLKLSDDSCQYVNVLGGCIYYCNISDSYKLYKMRTDGSGREKLCDDSAWDINVIGNMIYYHKQNDVDWIKRACTGESNGTMINDDDSCRIYRICTDGSNRTMINDDDSWHINVAGDWIFYTNDDGKLYKIRIDGTERTMLIDGEIGYINVYGNWVYYYDENDSNVYKMRIDGNEKTVLIPLSEYSRCEGICIAEDRIIVIDIYEYAFHNGSSVSLETKPIDGTDEAAWYFNVATPRIVYGDITQMQVDAIVNAANMELKNYAPHKGGGVCGAIFRAAGAEKLQAACDALAPIPTGEAVITEGFALPAKYIIHAAGPIYRGGDYGEEAELRLCYTNALQLAKENGCKSIAFPLISSGIYGYPREEAMKIASSAISQWLVNNYMDVSIVVFEERGNTPGNITNGGFAARQGEWIYYANSDNKLCKIRADGTGKRLLCDDECKFINVVGDWIFYCNESDDGKLYKIRANGTGRQQLCDDMCCSVNVLDGWIFYNNPKGIYKMRTDGSGRENLYDGSAWYINVIGNMIYYTSDYDGESIYRICTDGNNRTKISDDDSYDINVAGEWIFYTDCDDKLYRIRVDGSDRTVLSDCKIGHFIVCGNWIYYNDKDDYKVYKMRIDGNEKTVLNILGEHDTRYGICIVEDRIIVFNGDWNSSMGQFFYSLNTMPIDGTDEVAWNFEM